MMRLQFPVYVDDQVVASAYTEFPRRPGTQEEDGRWPSIGLWHPSGDHD